MIGHNNNNFHPGKAKFKLALNTMPPCCTQHWYKLFGDGTLPEEGTITCPRCQHETHRDAKGWWRRTNTAGVKQRFDKGDYMLRAGR